MRHEYVDSRFLFPSPLSPLGDFLMKFSEQSYIPLSIRSLEGSHSIDDMKIIMHNQASGAIRGFKENSKVGLTISEILATLSMSPKQQKAEINAIEKNDREAINNNSQNTHTQVTLDSNGFVRIFQRIATPLCGYNNKMIALSAISLELTQYTNLLHLLEIYKKFYDNANTSLSSINKLSDYLRLDTFFTKELALHEITALFAMVTDSRHKQTAALLETFYNKHCSPKTVSNYVTTIKDKLKTDIDIYQVLYHLREHYQRQSVLFQ